MGCGDFVGVVAGSGDSGEVRPCPCRETVARVEVSQSLPRWRLFCGLYFHFPTCRIGFWIGDHWPGDIPKFYGPFAKLSKLCAVFFKGYTMLVWFKEDYKTTR